MPIPSTRSRFAAAGALALLARPNAADEDAGFYECLLLPGTERRRPCPVPPDTQETEMSHTPHELAEEFPAEAAAISALRQANAHFARRVEEYHEVNRAIHRAETRVEPVSEAHETELRRRRMLLKDEIRWMLEDHGG